MGRIMRKVMSKRNQPIIEAIVEPGNDSSEITASAITKSTAEAILCDWVTHTNACQCKCNKSALIISYTIRLPIGAMLAIGIKKFKNYELISVGHSLNS